MNKDVKRQWVSALRSGEYEQGHGLLEVGGKFCCLGVLCDLAVKAGLVERKYFDRSGGISFMDPNDPVDGGPAGRPPQVVLEWAGLDAVSEGRLIRLNDIERLPFKEIANFIEEKL